MIGVFQILALLIAVVAGGACLWLGRGPSRSLGLLPVGLWLLGNAMPGLMARSARGASLGVMLALEVVAAILGIWLYNRVRIARIARIAEE